VLQFTSCTSIPTAAFTFMFISTLPPSVPASTLTYTYTFTFTFNYNYNCNVNCNVNGNCTVTSTWAPLPHLGE